MNMSRQVPKLNKEQRAYQHAEGWWYIFGGFIIGEILGFILGFEFASYNL